MPLTATETRELLERIGHTPRRQLGQNFLVDKNIVAKSVKLAALQPGERVVEIGPGLGTLTEALLQAGAEVWAVEQDPRLFAHLKDTLEFKFKERVHLLMGDAVENPLAGLPQPRESAFKVVANLPYAITTPWMDAVLSTWPPEAMVLMLQSESAARLTAGPGSKHYGAISVFLNATFDKLPGHKVKAQGFYPQPRVDSELVHLRLKPNPYTFQSRTKQIIRDIFTQRRKQIGTLARQMAGQEPKLTEWLNHLEALGFEPRSRPEELPLPAWQALDRLL